MKKNKYFFCFVLLIFMYSCSSKKDTINLLVGRYTDSGEKGMSLLEFDQKDGSLNLISESEAGSNPSYFCISKNQSLIYVANEVMDFNGGKGGCITTLSLDENKGAMQKINQFAVPNGSPCFISLSPNEEYLLLANYTGGSIAVVKLGSDRIPEKITDAISFEAEGESYSHPHMIAFDPSGKRVYLTDLGLDRIVIYTLDRASGKLHAVQNGIIKLPKGSGPRHFVFDPSGTKMYVICELNSTISSFDVDPDGLLDPDTVLSTLSNDFNGQSFCADIHISRDGKFLYGSNRGENNIATFKIDNNGMPSPIGHSPCGGDWPRNFVIDPSGKFILVGNERSGSISVASIDEKTGVPSLMENGFKVNKPTCLKFLD